MDRLMTYAGAIPLDTDILSTNKNAMVGLGWALQSILGTSTLIDGLACSPTAPASMQVQVAPGAIYSQQNVDSTAYSSLSADTTHSIVKQGLVADTTTFSCPAPSTSGYSVVYLIEAAYQDVDGGSTVLPYYNSYNPDAPYSGPDNTGVAQYTTRQGKCVLQLKTGIAATTGSQVTPTADAGFTALYSITVANTDSTITSGKIATVSGAPFIKYKIPDLAPPQAVVGNALNARMYIETASTSGTFTADELILETAFGGTVYKVSNFNQAIDISSNGAGGMDTGLAPISGYVALYAIYNPTTSSASLLAVNATSSIVPNIYSGSNMPAGYVASALVSVWPTNSSRQLSAGFQQGRIVSFTPIIILSTTTQQTSFTTLSIAGAVPPNAKTVSGIASAYTTSTTNGITTSLASSGSGTSGIGQLTYIINAATSGAGLTSMFAELGLSTPQSIVYYSVSAGATLTLNLSVSKYTF